MLKQAIVVIGFGVVEVEIFVAMGFLEDGESFG
jgi:hypothetical protein